MNELDHITYVKDVTWEGEPLSSQYDEDYFLRGKETGKSLYENYRWLPDLTIPMVQRIIDHCGISQRERVLDFGCARGYVVKAFRQLGYNPWGVDASEWAVENCDSEVVGLVWQGSTVTEKYDWIIAKDVLEHIPYVLNTIGNLMHYATKGIFVVVPLSEYDSPSCYVVKEYEKDRTHVQRHTLIAWVKMFLRPGWSVEASYRVPGIKDNYAQYEKGNGFIVARRIQS